MADPQIEITSTNDKHYWKILGDTMLIGAISGAADSLTKAKADAEEALKEALQRLESSGGVATSTEAPTEPSRVEPKALKEQPHFITWATNDAHYWRLQFLDSAGQVQTRAGCAQSPTQAEAQARAEVEALGGVWTEPEVDEPEIKTPVEPSLENPIPVEDAIAAAESGVLAEAEDVAGKADKPEETTGL